jgi:hypothetical protein
LWFEKVFLEEAIASEHLILVLKEVFMDLDPKLDFCIEAGLKQQDQPLNYLIMVKQVMNDHVSAWNNLICNGKLCYFCIPSLYVLLWNIFREEQEFRSIERLGQGVLLSVQAVHF